MELTIQPTDLYDLDDIMTWVNNPEIAGRFEWFTGNITREQEEKILDNILASETDTIYTARLPDGTYIGQAGLHDIDGFKARTATLVGNTEAWGRGYGTQLMLHIVKEGFGKHNLHYLYATPRADNKRSRHVLEKCGFTCKQLMPKSYSFKGQLIDMVHMGLYRANDELQVAA